jgi:hypothetical protein
VRRLLRTHLGRGKLQSLQHQQQCHQLGQWQWTKHGYSYACCERTSGAVSSSTCGTSDSDMSC